MQIDLFYIEAEHDTVPGVVRELAATEQAASDKADELLMTGAYVYRQNMSVDVPLIYSHVEVEAALCVWEHLCEITVCTDKPDPAWNEYRESIGSVELRHESIEIGKWVLQVYDLLPEWYRASGAYDWEIVPAIVGKLTPGQTHPDPYTTKYSLLNSDSAKAEYFRDFDAHLKFRYGLTVEEAGIDMDDFLATWFQPDAEPDEQVRRYAEKYNLERVR
ncbi:MAG: hypothetical protein EOR77_21390 [Mesorhizobium sp.]|uniref:hypothetical protein n=1 Tax=Mesorhizobium sp. TaxID=1871066 RepID=UPI000FE9E926|nr:hypothetical protein [Mesorhizobium sp.]RWM32587.1 MAG: hypothetical protein EOR77_21390 [Mesorhizobium sp.]